MIYDGIGKTTFPASLDCLAPLGMFVSFGSASGQIDAFNINILQAKGSLFATRPTLNTYAAKRADLLAIANDLFEVVASGAVKIPVNQKYALQGRRESAPRPRRPRHHRLVDPGAVRPDRRNWLRRDQASIAARSFDGATALAVLPYWRRCGWAILAFLAGQFVAAWR